MNHTIIKKALNEALTQKYYDELMGSEDEEHIFGVGFTADMKRLIRKMDDKLLYYAKYAAIAACACIAIGCAVLLPNLINSGIDVEPPVTTTSEVGIATTPNETTLPIIITTTEGTTTEITTLPPVIETSPTGITEEIDDTNPGQGFETTTTTSSPVTETEKIPETENDENPGSAGGDEDTDADRDSPDTGVDMDGDIIIDDEGDDCLPLPEEGDDVVVEEDDSADIEADTEEEVEIEDDSDSDDDVIVDVEDDEVEEDDEYVEPVPLLSATLGEAVGQLLLGDPSADLNDKIYTERLIYMGKLSEDVAASTFDLSSVYSDLDFVTRYVIDNADAPRTDTEGDYTKDYLLVHMSDVTANPPVFYNYSICNKYEEFYGPQVDVEDEEEVMDDEVINNGYSQISLSIYQNDIIEVWQSGYVTAYFEAETSELFTIIENKGFSKTPKTVGDVITDLNLTADNIRNAYGRVNDIYDLSLGNAHIDTAADKSALISFLNKIKSKKLTAVKENLRYSEMANIQLTVNGDPALIEIRMLDDKLYFTDDSTSLKWYSTPVTQSEMEEFITLICKSENLKTPVFYKTMDEYIKNAMGSINATDAEYSETKSGVTTYYIIKDKAVVDKLAALVNKWTKKAEYEPFYKYPSTRTEWLYINTGGYTMTISSDNSAKIWVNHFTAPAGFFDEIKEFMVKNGVTSVEEEYTVEDDVAYEDDVEEDIAIEDEIDY